ncbi:MAG: hypothetical protein KC589_04390 [Nanoarchaeota archaeon]|nr:hypothetical protein [Nanoarchaeota archaeon]
MKLFIAAILDGAVNREIFMESEFNLQTFYYMNKYKERMIEEFIKSNGQDNFILDSGAFSMFSGSVKKLNYSYLKTYIDKYCDYINYYDIKNFIEMDIDRIIGYETVLKIREYIKNKTNKKPIEVWHTWRGIDEFKKSCKENEWVFVGIKEKVNKIKTFQYLIDLAFEYGTKLHILGYTPLYLEKFKNLYSCDSTTWSSGGRYSNVYFFENNKMTMVKKPDNTMRREDTDVYLDLNEHNLRQWIKYQKFLKDKSWKL